VKVSASTAAAGLAGGRALIGVALVAVPAPLTRLWTGDDRPSTLVVGRGLGARDLALGAGALVALRRGRDARAWIAAGIAGDVADLASSLAAGDAIPRTGRLGTAALAGGAAIAGAWLLRALD
jgi:hypothetical protein